MQTNSAYYRQQTQYDQSQNDWRHDGLPETLRAVLNRGEHGLVVEQHLNDRISFYYLIAQLTRLALLEEHGVPHPNDASLASVQHAANRPEAWRQLYRSKASALYGDRLRNVSLNGSQFRKPEE